MRAAIQISGEFRCLSLTLQSFQTYVLDDLHRRGYSEIHIFCHCWKKEEFDLGTFPFEGRGDWHLGVPVYGSEQGLNIYKPSSYLFENIEDVEILKGRSRVLCMYYGIWMVNKIRKAFEKEYDISFDLVVRYRTDLVLETNLLEDKPDQKSFLVIPKSTLAKTCDGPFDNDSHICDYIAYGTADRMDIYCSVFETWLPIPQTPIGESCLAMHLKRFAIKSIRTFLPFYLVNGDGTKRGVENKPNE